MPDSVGAGNARVFFNTPIVLDTVGRIQLYNKKPVYFDDMHFIVNNWD